MFERSVPLQPGGRRLPRPGIVETCPHCSAAVGTNYPVCAYCSQLVERFWLADWQALLSQEKVAAGTEDESLLAAVVFEEMDRHPWTVVDIAMSLLHCQSCGQELGGGPLDCTTCQLALGNSGYYDIVAGEQGQMSGNEHALRVGRRMLRHPHRYPETALRNWRLSFPRLLTGWLPSTKEAQAMATLMRSGHVDEVRQLIEDLDREIAEGRR